MKNRSEDAAAESFSDFSSSMTSQNTKDCASSTKRKRPPCAAAASIADSAYNTELHAFFFQFLLRPVSTEASVKLRLLAVAADATAHGERSLPCPPLLRPFVL